jgi:hypothetical protein
MPERSWFIAEGKGGRHRMTHPVIERKEVAGHTPRTATEFDDRGAGHEGGGHR